MRMNSAGEVVEISPRDPITKHFQYREFSTNADPYPPAFFERLQRLASILEFCRKVTGQSIRITSCYRAPGPNKAAGGASKSQHLFGRAMDFRDYRGENDLTRLIYAALQQDVVLDELMIGGLGWYPLDVPKNSPLWVKDGPRRPLCRIHVDIRPRLAGGPVARWTH